MPEQKSHVKKSHVKKIPIDIDNDGIPDGYLEVDSRKMGIVSKEHKQLQEELKNFKMPKSVKLDVPRTATINLEFELEPGKKIQLGASRALTKKENYESVHMELYLICLDSLAKIIEATGD